MISNTGKFLGILIVAAAAVMSVTGVVLAIDLVRAAL